jgi:hypothetical protein
MKTRAGGSATNSQVGAVEAADRAQTYRDKFARAVADKLPSELSKEKRMSLGRLAFSVQKARGLTSPSDRERWEEAKKIQGVAAKLLKMVDAWHASSPAHYLDPRARESAIAVLSCHLLDESDALTADTLAPEEINAALVGLDRQTLSLALLGLQVHLDRMCALDRDEAGRLKHGRRSERHKQTLAFAVFDAFGRDKLTITRGAKTGKNPSPAVRACEVLFAEAGVTMGGIDDLIRRYEGGNNLIRS